VARYHHVIGDALFGLRIGEVVTGTEASPGIPAVTDVDRAAVGVAPRTGSASSRSPGAPGGRSRTAGAGRGTSTGASRSCDGCAAGAVASSGP
jgi:hypothetical protein